MSYTGPRWVTNLLVTKGDGTIVFAPHADGSGIIRLGEDGATMLRDTLTERLGEKPAVELSRRYRRCSCLAPIHGRFDLGGPASDCLGAGAALARREARRARWPTLHGVPARTSRSESP